MASSCSLKKRICSPVSLVIEADPAHNDAKMRLAEIYEVLNEPRKALELVYQGMTHPTKPSHANVLCFRNELAQATSARGYAIVAVGGTSWVVAV